METQFMLITVSSEVRLDDEQTDMTISINESEFKVHKAVMSRVSPYFRCLLSSDWLNKEQQSVGIPAVSNDTLSLIVKYAYSGSVQITEEIVQELFVVVDFLLITELLEKCCQFIETRLSPESCICIYMFAFYYKTSSLYQNAKWFVQYHFENVVKASTDFLELSLEQLEEIVDGDELNMTNEHLVFETILRWIDHAPEARNKHMAVLLPKVRLGLMDPIYMSENVRKNALVSADETCSQIISSVIESTDDVSHLSRPRLPSSVLFAVSVGEWEVYDIKINRWFTMHNVKRSRLYQSTVIVDQCLYCYYSEDLKNVMKMDLRTQIWQEVSPMNERREDVSIAVLDGLIYAIGGYDRGSFLNTAECYDPRTDQWTPLTPMSERRSYASATSLDGLIYICGGYNGSGCLSTVECYDPKTRLWRSIQSMRRRCCCQGVIAYANRIYAVGGWDGFFDLRTVEAYDPHTSQWETIDPMKTSRRRFGIEVIDDLLFVVGGCMGTDATTSVEFYDSEKREWREAGKLNKAQVATQLNCVLERNAKDAVEKICQLFSAFLHLEPIPSAQDGQKTRLKPCKKEQKTLRGASDQAHGGLHRSQNTDQFILVPEEKIVVSWVQDEIAVNEHVEKPAKSQKTVMRKKETSAKNAHPRCVILQDSDSEGDFHFEELQSEVSSVIQDGEAPRSLSVLKSTGMRVHRRKKGKAFSCKRCRRTFDSLVLLRAHEVVHVATEKPFCCSQCDRHFGSKGSLDVHQQLHTDTSPYACKHCGKTFTEHKQLAGHQRIHNEDQTFTCKVCGKLFHQAYGLRKHLVVHSGEKLHQCETCGKEFHFRNNLLRHQRIHTGEKPFTCQTCGRSFNQVDSLKAHTLTHTGEKPHKCKTCEQGFVQKWLLRLHEGQLTGQNGHGCIVCGEVLGCINTIKIHLPIHAEQLPITCMECGEVIDSINTLKAHQQKHTVTTKFSCSVCGKSFQSVASMNTHERIHTGEKPYCCSVCGKTFRQQNCLKAHQSLHTGEKPFSCDVCSKSFCTLGNLRRHQRIHTGEKPFTCVECGRGFSQSNSLKAHMHIHTGEKQYVCHMCGKSFAYLRNLRSHKCI